MNSWDEDDDDHEDDANDLDDRDSLATVAEKSDVRVLLFAEPTLSEAGEDEREVFTRYQATHDPAIRDHLILANTRLVRALAVRYVANHRTGSLTLDDLIQEGMFGLMTAIERYDLAVGAVFSTYASRWILQAIMRAVGDKAELIREPIHVQTDRSKDKRAGLPFPARPHVTALEAPLNPERGDESETLADVLPDPATAQVAERAIEQAYWRETLYVALDKIPNRQRYIIALRYGLDRDEEDRASGYARTLEECGQLLGISRERVRQIEVNALTQLRLLLRETAEGDTALRVLALIKSKRAAWGRQRNPAQEPRTPERRRLQSREYNRKWREGHPDQARERAREAQRRYRDKKRAAELAAGIPPRRMGRPPKRASEQTTQTQQTQLAS